MEKFQSDIEYREFEETEHKEDNSIYMSVEEDDQQPQLSNDSTSFRSINLNESEHIYNTHNTHNIWKPNFENSWNFGQPRKEKKSYYDTDSITESIDETRDLLKTHMGHLNERKSKIRNLENISSMLDSNASKFQKKSKQLRYQQCQKYAFHIILIILLVIFIIILIVILVKS